ncbi:MAG: serine/threonine-protein kinase, partial [Planctomycetota bacterium]|nr:serine/threonine-protein kinase [Planctomycetota bacterium]
FIVMDYIEGKSLDQFIKQGEPWPLERVTKLLEPLVNALDHMHGKGIIHRDLKPANILIRDHDGAPLITDFGLAKETNLETLTQTGEILGTPNYMAPEQFSGHAISRQTDVWALAVIVFNLLSGGSSPFKGETLVQLANAILRNPGDFDSIPPSSRHLTTVLERSLSKSSQERFETCHDFLAALNASKAPTRTFPLALVLATVVTLVAFIGCFLIASHADKDMENANTEGLQRRRLEIKAAIEIAQNKFPEHYFQHICAEFPQPTTLSKATLKECANLSALRDRVQQFEEQIKSAKFTSKKLKKQLARWRELSESYLVFEKNSEDEKAHNVSAELELGKFVRAYFIFKENPEQSAEILEFAPENQKWRPAWFLIRAMCAKKAKKNARTLMYLRLLQKENPKLFSIRLLKELWRSEILVIQGRGKLKPRERFKDIFYHWRLKKLDPDFKIPEAYREAFSPEGQLNLQYLNKKISNLIARSPQQIFDITIDAADHGIYLDILDDNQSRQMLHSQGIAEQNFRGRPQHGPSIFWRAYVQRPYSILNGQSVSLAKILKDIESALKHKLPSFQRAQLLGQRAQILSEHRRNNTHKYDIDVFKKNCLDDIEEALKLSHPRPHLLIMQKFKVLVQFYEVKKSVKEKKIELFDLLDQYLA